MKEIKIYNFNLKKYLKFWQEDYIDSNFLIVEIKENGFIESYFYNSLEG